MFSSFSSNLLTKKWNVFKWKQRHRQHKAPIMCRNVYSDCCHCQFTFNKCFFFFSISRLRVTFWIHWKTRSFIHIEDADIIWVSDEYSMRLPSSLQRMEKDVVTRWLCDHANRGWCATFKGATRNGQMGDRSFHFGLCPALTFNCWDLSIYELNEECFFVCLDHILIIVHSKDPREIFIRNNCKNNDCWLTSTILLATIIYHWQFIQSSKKRAWENKSIPLNYSFVACR